MVMMASNGRKWLWFAYSEDNEVVACGETLQETIEIANRKGYEHPIITTSEDRRSSTERRKSG